MSNRCTSKIDLGDCLGVMRTMPTGCVDAVICDPPYCSGGFTETEKKGAKAQGIQSQRAKEDGFVWFPNDNMSTAGLIWLLREMMIEADRLLVDGGSALVFTDWRMVPHLAPALESSGLQYRNMIVWDKGSPGLGNGFKPTHEIILHYAKSNPKFYTLTGSNMIRNGRMRPDKKMHETQKPVELMAKLIEVVTPEGGTVLDPFCGSGSTGEAALKLGRNFIGIEKSEIHHKTATTRLRAVQMEIETNLFAPETLEK